MKSRLFAASTDEQHREIKRASVAEAKRLVHIGIPYLLTLTAFVFVACIVFVTVMSQIELGEDDTALNNALNITSSIKLYKSEHGHYPESLDDLAKVHAQKPSFCLSPQKRPMIERVPTDPWGKAYDYRIPGTSKAVFDIISAGKDGIFETPDDISASLVTLGSKARVLAYRRTESSGHRSNPLANSATRQNTKAAP